MGVATERESTAGEIVRLADEVGSRDPAVALVLRRLAEAVRAGRYDEARGYADAVEPRTLAEVLAGRRSLLWGILESARNVLVFAPIAVTWYALSTAGDAYTRLLTDRPEFISRPFLLLWQEGFGRTPGVMSFSTLAVIDATLIALVIALSLLIHVRSDLRDVAARTRALLRESAIRAILGHATSLASRNGVSETEADALLDEMVAEERRIFERGMEREERLVDLEVAVQELRTAAAQLARAAEALKDGQPPRARRAQRARAEERAQQSEDPTRPG